MQEIVQQLLGYLKGIWNKRWQAMIITWLVCFIGWGVIYLMPNEYQSKAKLYIDTQSVLKPLLKGLTVQYNVQQQINLMIRTLLTRPNVEKIIRLADLDLTITNDKELDDLVEKLQRSITFRKPGGRRSPNVYNLSYTSESPEVAQTVVQSVITVFIENSIGDSVEDSRAARKFLNRKIEEYEKRLETAEVRRKNFKQENMGLLPSDGRDYFSRMEGAKNKLAQAKLQLKESEKREISLSHGLSAQVNALKFKTQYDGRIELLEKKLDDLLLNYTDSHPDVLSMQRLIADLQKNQAQEMKKRQASGIENNVLKESAAYQNMKASYRQAKAESEALRVRVTVFEERAVELKRLANIVPEVEIRLIALNRDYSITKKKYEDFLNRKESALISQSVDQTTESVQFKVLEAPRYEDEPVGPKRILLSSIILGVGIIFGIVSAFFFSQIRPVVTSGYEVSQLLGLPHLGNVSANDSPAQKRRRGFMVFSYLSLVVVLFACYGLIVSWYLFAQVA